MFMRHDGEELREKSRFTRFLPAVFWAALNLQPDLAMAEVRQEDCAALEYVLALEGQMSELDLDARDALARRIERHGQSFGLTPSQVRLQALALRDNDTDLSDLNLTDSPRLRQAHADCVQIVDSNTPDQGFVPNAGQTRSTNTGGGSRFSRISLAGQQVAVSWMALAGLSALVALTGAMVWALTVAERRKRRRARRYNCDMPASFRLEDGPALAVRVTDISQKGCCLTLDGVVAAPGARATLDIGRTRIDTRVVWCNKYFCGVEFVTDLAVTQVQDLLHQHQTPDLAEGMPEKLPV